MGVSGREARGEVLGGEEDGGGDDVGADDVGAAPRIPVSRELVGSAMARVSRDETIVRSFSSYAT